MSKENESDPIQQMLTIDDEDLRGKTTDDAKLNVDPPDDKVEKTEKQAKSDEKDDKGETRERNPDGTFKEKAGDKDEKADKKDTVPLAKYMEEKNQLRAELAQKDITLKQYQDQLAALNAKQQKAPDPEPDEPPDFLADPKGYVDHKAAEAIAKIEQANKQLAESTKKVDETAQQTREQVELQNFFQGLRAHEAQFVKTTPDYNDALAHVRNLRAQQMKMFDPNVTPQQIMEVITREETQLAVHLAQRGIDPVKTAYDLAVTYGYQKKAPPPPPGGQQQRDPNQLPPDQTLGHGGGSPDLERAPDDIADPFEVAFASLAKSGRRG